MGPVESTAGRLVIAGTPLGNPADASIRLRELLADADVIAAEDTRRFRRLASDLGVSVTARVVSFHESAERSRIPALLDALAAGSLVVLVSDAGMPGVSDPGYRLVRAAIDAGHAVSVAPGPSAALAALVVSGLPVDRFCFEGFLPRRSGERTSRLRELAGEQRTLVFFEAPHRVHAMLRDLAEVFGARQIAVCRELTKTYEEVIRGDLRDLADSLGEVRGEVTVVVAGRRVGDASEMDLATLVDLVGQRVAAGADRRVALAEVAAEAGVPRRRLYDAIVAAKRPL
jgi:16S rRNA (cytidine1402-2'-O)-methyltransferase